MDATVPLLGKNGMAESSSSEIDMNSEDKGCDTESKDEGRRNSPLPTEKKATSDMKLRSIAFILALIEKAACTIGTLNFIWATVVLLGSFVQSLESIDFWLVSIILAIEGLRILSRNGELGIESLICRSWSPSLLLMLLYSLVIQYFSAILCIEFSIFRLSKQLYGSDDNLNRNEALNIFYLLSTVESFLTLLGLLRFLAFALLTPPADEKKKLDKVREKLYLMLIPKNGFQSSQILSLRHFFCDTYCRCINGSVFDGLKMDFLSHSIKLLLSRDNSDQLMGARLLCTLAKNDEFAEETLRAIGTMEDVVKRLIEMLNWDKHDDEEEENRKAAAEIICKLVEIPRNRIRVMALPESMESITSLLYDRKKIGIHSRKKEVQYKDKYQYKQFTVQGLQILKIFANDPNNCGKIGTRKALLCKIIELNPEALESEILRHLEITPMETLETLAHKQDVRDNTDETSDIEADHSDDPRLQSISIN